MNNSSNSIDDYQGDFTIVGRCLMPTEANMLCSCLNVAGIPAKAGDTNFVYNAKEMISPYQRGEFALEENFEDGQSKTTATLSVLD